MDGYKTTMGRYYPVVKNIKRTRPINGQDRGMFDRQVIKDKIDALTAECYTSTDGLYREEMKNKISELNRLQETLETLNKESADIVSGDYTGQSELIPDEMSTLLDRAIAETAISNHLNGYISHERCEKILKRKERGL